MACISLNSVSYIYSSGTPFEKLALDDVSVTFDDGVITGLIGHTGSGKSTLVQLLNGLLKPTKGEILFDNVNIWENPKKISDFRYKIGLVLQYPEYQLFEETVEKDIAYGPLNMGLSSDEVEKRVKEAAYFCGVSDEILKKSPFELSGGQKRRVAIAGVVAMKPDVLILDEPAAGLDPIGREEILGGLRSFQRHSKSTMIIVSHSMEDVASYCDNIVVLSKSKLYKKGKVKEIFGDTKSLLDVGLDVPQITHFLNKLRDDGINIRSDIFTVDEAVKEMLSLIKEREAEK